MEKYETKIVSGGCGTMETDEHSEDGLLRSPYNEYDDDDGGDNDDDDDDDGGGDDDDFDENDGDNDSIDGADTADSLEIKPPQAAGRSDHYRYKEKKSRDKKHSKERRHKEKNRIHERDGRSDRRYSAGGSGAGGHRSDRDRGDRDRERDRERHHQLQQQSQQQLQQNRQVPNSNDIRYEMHTRERDYYRHMYKERERFDKARQKEHHDKKRKELSPDKSDAERALEDLRSRLLSKRNKQDAERRFDEQHDDDEYRSERAAYRQSHHYEYKKSREESRKDQHHQKHRNRKNIIEVIDSPETYVDPETIEQQSTKHQQQPLQQQQHQKEYYKESAKQKAIEDPELLARRAKLLEAEREMAKRKEMARNELEARREMRRERGDEPLSPPSLLKKRKHVDAEQNVRKTRKRQKDDGVIHVSDNSVDEDDDTGSDDTDTNSNTDTDEGGDGSDVEEEVPVSPLSVGELSKSERGRRRSRSRQSGSRSISRSRSKSRSRSRSPYRSRSRTRSKSRSRSRTASRSPQFRNRSRPATPDSDFEKDKNPDGPGAGDKNGDQDDDNTNKADDKKTNTGEVKQKPNETTGAAKNDANDDNDANNGDEQNINQLPNYFPGLQGCRSVEEFKCLNRIEEGTYGVVYRAQDKRTDEIVALKRLKMEKEREGFPITSLREINTLLKGQHPNIVTVREIVVGSNLDKIYIVMDYVEHDLKSLMETMKHRKQGFLPTEVKCLVQQLLRAVGHLHDNWILHRDLKTSNLLLSHKGILKVGDFGLAREYGSPLKAYTSIVVTLWYRAPELLLCCKEYSTPIDMWSVGCIFAELLSMQALFPGKSEIDQLNRIFKDLGTPNEKIWPGYNELPAVKKMTFAEFPVSNLRKKFSHLTSELGLSLLQGLLTYDPKQRFTAEQGLASSYFKELPLPIDPSMFPTWPAKSELGTRKALASSPKPPSGGGQFKQLGDNDDNHGFMMNQIDSRQLAMGPGFSLKF